jgi:tripartite-type tricarboxylate transporter receptor subunit TctC
MISELATGVLKIGWCDPASPLPFIASGKLRAIAVSGSTRLPRTPEVPTLGEQGYAFDTVGWFGLFAPAGTPKVIIERLSEEIRRIQAMPDMVAKAAAFNVTPSSARSPEQFREIVTKDLQTWKKIVSDAGIKLE